MSQSRLEALKRFLEQDPNDSFTRYAVALEYVALNQFEDAISILEKLQQKDPKYLATYQQLGHLYAKNGLKEQARRIYKLGVEVADKAGERHTASKLQEALEQLG
jgi:tetratricopeptide (TPR) repeat protein